MADMRRYIKMVAQNLYLFFTYKRELIENLVNLIQFCSYIMIFMYVFGLKFLLGLFCFVSDSSCPWVNVHMPSKNRLAIKISFFRLVQCNS